MELDQTGRHSLDNFLCLFYMFHRRYSSCRPLNSARYNRIISRKHVIFWEAVVHIARVGDRLPRLQIQFRISRSFRPRNLANLGSKIRFWIRRKEHNACTLVPTVFRWHGKREFKCHFHFSFSHDIEKQIWILLFVFHFRPNFEKRFCTSYFVFVSL